MMFVGDDVDVDVDNHIVSDIANYIDDDVVYDVVNDDNIDVGDGVDHGNIDQIDN